MDVPRIKSWLSGFVNTIDQLSALSMMSNKDTSSTDRQDKAPLTDVFLEFDNAFILILDMYQRIIGKWTFNVRAPN